MIKDTIQPLRKYINKPSITTSLSYKPTILWQLLCYSEIVCTPALAVGLIACNKT